MIRCVCGIDEDVCMREQQRAQCADSCEDRASARLVEEGVHCAWCDQLIMHEDGFAPDEAEGDLICETCNDRCERLRERGITLCPDCGVPTHASESDDTGRCEPCRVHNNGAALAAKETIMDANLDLCDPTPTDTLVQIGLGRSRGGRADLGVVTTDEIDHALARNAPVAIGVSGGKDSCALAFATIEHLDRIGHTGPRVLIHSDLGRVEWRDSLPTCERLAAALGLELIVVRREAGDMMDRWLVRWSNNVERYVNLECVKVILPWSTPSMRFCTSELKTAVICRALTKRFPGQTIVSACGIRRAESSSRAKAPVAKEQPKLASKTHRTTGLDWHPIIDWEHADVFASLEARGFALHEAYTKYGMSRVSCAFCIMSNTDDKLAATTCPDNHDLYREMVDLEIQSTFAFQGASWLADVAPHLLTEDQRHDLKRAKFYAEQRAAAEAWLPDHLLYEKGWPHTLPTTEEAEQIARMRRDVATWLGIRVRYTTAETVRLRYEYLMADNADDDATMRRVRAALANLGEVMS